MKVELTPNGLLRVIPETGAEAYALRQWANNAVVIQRDHARMEDHHIRGSYIDVCTEVQ